MVMEKSSKKEIVISVTKKVAFVATWFLVGYGLAALTGDIHEMRKGA
jgi:hypothetical protein